MFPLSRRRLSPGLKPGVCAARKTPINTASHIDHPQLARCIEIVDNADGTMSLFTTLVEAQSPYQVDHGDFSQSGLASLYRELSVNDLYSDPADLGSPADRNVELLVAAHHPAR